MPLNFRNFILMQLLLPTSSLYCMLIAKYPQRVYMDLRLGN